MGIFPLDIHALLISKKNNDIVKIFSLLARQLNYYLLNSM